MLDIGWPELFLIAVVTIIVVGPKELPRVVRTVNGVIRKIRGLASDFQSTLDDMAREADLEDIKKEIEKASQVDVADEFKSTIDPSGTLDGAFDIGGPIDDGKPILPESQAAAIGTGAALADDTETPAEAVSEEPPVMPGDEPRAEIEPEPAAVDEAVDEAARQRSGA